LYTTAQSNNLTSTALSVTNAQTAYTAMTSFKDDKGEPAGVRPTHIMVPEALRFEAEKIFNPQGTGDTNANTVMK
jgi:phage major head subunit gpT-like protein